jgi:hypothetical protein
VWVQLLIVAVTEDMGVSMGFQPRVQKFSSILMKLSAFVELLILSILIKKLFQKAFIFTEIYSKYFYY